VEKPHAVHPWTNCQQWMGGQVKQKKTKAKAHKNGAIKQTSLPSRTYVTCNRLYTCEISLLFLFCDKHLNFLQFEQCWTEFRYRRRPIRLSFWYSFYCMPDENRLFLSLFIVAVSKKYLNWLLMRILDIQNMPMQEAGLGST